MIQRLSLFVVFLIVGFSSVLAQSSDTLSVYFEFGKHELTAKQLRRIQSIPHNIYVNDLDSVHYIGMADSVGSIKANKKLGERRAREVAKYSKKYFTSKPVIKILSRGELASADVARSRRVDVIFYKKPEEIVEEDIPVADTLCLKRADSLFHRSLVRDIKFRRKDYVSIETIMDGRDLRSYYYMRTDARKNLKDTFSIYKIRWSRSNSSSAIDKSPDYYTKIPKSDFDKFKVFTVTKSPCNNLHIDEDEYFKQESGPIAKCLQVDRFLMHHLQVKKIPFNEEEVYVRVPKVYVNVSQDYTFYERGDTVKWSNVVPRSKSTKEKRDKTLFRKWRERKRNKKEKKAAAGKFYYTRVRVKSNFRLVNIMREMDCSPSYSEPSEGSKPICSTLGPCIIKCGGGLDLFAEAGSHLFLDERRNYIALGTLKTKGFHSLRVSMGISDSLSFYGSLGYDYKLINFGITNPKQLSSWSEPHKIKAPKTYFSMYGGTRINTFEFRDDNWSWNQNVHLGASLQRNILSLETNIFAEGGLGVNYNLPQYNTFSPYYQVGVRLFISKSDNISNQVGNSARFL